MTPSQIFSRPALSLNQYAHIVTHLFTASSLEHLTRPLVTPYLPDLINILFLHTKSIQYQQTREENTQTDQLENTNLIEYPILFNNLQRNIWPLEVTTTNQVLGDRGYAA